MGGGVANDMPRRNLEYRRSGVESKLHVSLGDVSVKGEVLSPCSAVAHFELS